MQLVRPLEKPEKKERKNHCLVKDFTMPLNTLSFKFIYSGNGLLAKGGKEHSLDIGFLVQGST